ncbi:MAG: sodium:solute symporter, partial [Saprospiraceae bacterium]
DFDLADRYNFWSGILGGTFLFLAYFGTDQSQVSRYLSGKSLSESRLGLLMNGLIKIPMQLAILFCGVLLFVFFQFHRPPLHFNNANERKVKTSEFSNQYAVLEKENERIFEIKKEAIGQYLNAEAKDNRAESAKYLAEVNGMILADKDNRRDAKGLILRSNPKAELKDTDYVFINYIINYLPIGLIGLLLAVIFSAAMSSTSSEINALSTTTVVDLYRRFLYKSGTDLHYLRASKWFTLMWGVVALCFAMTASLFENLIQAVNIVGSIFYGTILGIFMTAFFLKSVGGKAVFWAGVLTESMVLYLYFGAYTDKIGFLWLNMIGCVGVMVFSLLLNLILRQDPKAATT